MGCCVANSNKQAALDKIRQRGEQTLINLQAANYAGGKFGNCKNDGLICLTDKHIYFIGACCCQTKLEIPVDTITGVESAKSYRREHRLKPVMILSFSDGNNCGFYVRDIQQWSDQLQKKNFDQI